MIDLTHNTPMNIALRTIASCFLLTGIILGGDGLWIPTKARLAQFLLEIAWKRERGGRPTRPWPWADTHPVAKLTIERDGTEAIVLAGASGRTMAFGPGHVDGTALPGERGNCVITAHRDTHFAALRYVIPGDVVVLQSADGRIVRYSVTSKRIVRKEDTSVLRQSGRSRLTLITCYPFDAIRPGTPLRYVVVAEPVKG